jgi:hypothetical protein
MIKPTPKGRPGIPETHLQRLIDKAKQDLAQRFMVEVRQVALVKVEAVSWADTSLGVPESGKVYAQVITPGFKIILSVQGKKYKYHTDYEQVIFAGPAP